MTESILDHGPAEGRGAPRRAGRLSDGLDEPDDGEDDVEDEEDEEEARRNT